MSKRDGKKECSLHHRAIENIKWDSARQAAHTALTFSKCLAGGLVRATAATVASSSISRSPVPPGDHSKAVGSCQRQDHSPYSPSSPVKMWLATAVLDWPWGASPWFSGILEAGSVHHVGSGRKLAHHWWVALNPPAPDFSHPPFAVYLARWDCWSC